MYMCASGAYMSVFYVSVLCCACSCVPWLYMWLRHVHIYLDLYYFFLKPGLIEYPTMDAKTIILILKGIRDSLFRGHIWVTAAWEHGFRWPPTSMFQYGRSIKKFLQFYQTKKVIQGKFKIYLAWTSERQLQKYEEICPIGLRCYLMTFLVWGWWRHMGLQS